MDKLKQVLSGGHRKSLDADQSEHGSTADQSRLATSTGGLQGEGSHLTGAKQSTAGTNVDERHPIYDQFTGHSTSGEPTRTTEQPPHFSNTTNLSQTTPTTMEGSRVPEQSTSAATSDLRPDATHRATGGTTGGMSTASIKSGVLGFPQGGDDKHAAMGNTPIGSDTTRAGNSDQLAGTQGQTSNKEHDAALGAGAVGAGTVGGLSAREIMGRHEDNTPKQQMHALADQRTSDLNSQSIGQPIAEKPTGRPLEPSTQAPNVTTDTDRAFPLAGGVTSRNPAEGDSTTSQIPPTITERERGTTDRDVQHGHGDGREALAGAAAAGAAATAASGLRSEHEHGATQPAPSGLKTEGDFGGPSASSTTKQEGSGAPGGVGTAFQDLHGHGGQGHNYDGPRFVDETKATGAPLFTEGPHVTDTANRLDPHFHVPGEFPDPTPVEEPAQPTFAGKTEGPVTLPSAGQSSNIPAERATEGHHYGRDAALAGGAGAAGLGAYEAGKHHQREATDTGMEPTSAYASPYSSQKLDPRVHPSGRGVEGLDEQRFDPSAKSAAPSHDHRGRDAGLVGGAAAGAGLAGHEASKHYPEKETVPSSASTQQPTSQDLSQSEKGPHDAQHHYGRDAALGGAAAATAGGVYASQKEDTGPASSTIGPHKSNVANVLDPRVQPDPAQQKHHQAGPTSEDPASATVGPHTSNVANIVDPRVQPEPEKMKGKTTTGPHQSDTLNRLDPKVDEKAQSEGQHHYGRDAAVAGGAGAAGVGAYEAAKTYGEHRSTQPTASMEEQRYDPTAQGAHDPTKPGQHHYGRDAAVAGGLGAAGTGAYEHAHHGEKTTPATGGVQPASAQQSYPSQQPTARGTEDPAQTSQHHYGRDAAAAGGVGAAGLGAYEYAHHGEKTAPAATGGVQPPSVQQSYPSQQQTTREAQDPTQTSQHHYGRDAAVAGGLGAAGIGAHEYAHREKPVPEGVQPSSTQQTYAPQDAAGAHQRYDSVQDPKNDSHAKRDTAIAAGATGAAGAGAGYEFSKHEAEKRQKEQEKAFQQQQKEIEKQHAHDQKEQAKHQKGLEKEHEGKEKKHHLFGFLHRDKKDKDDSPTETSPRDSKESPRHSKEYAAAGAAGAAGVGTTAAAYGAGGDLDENGKRHHNKLHKDPPPGHPAREALETQQHHQHMGVDGPIGRPDEISGDHETRAGVYGAHPIGDHDAQDHRVIEPHTGLPMNVDKFGDGHGGTDGSKTVDGYHQVPGVQGTSGAGAQQGVTDWDAIKKANTPY